MSDTLDPDIAATTLSEGEKNGLQIFRNYSKAFDDHRAKQFAAATNPHPQAISELAAMLRLIASEEPRTLPLLVCAFADDQLERMYRREFPESIPGGRKEVLSGFGPLARLSQRIQMAFAFEWLSRDLLIELDNLRRIRNDLSHKWDINLLELKLSELIEQRQQRIEEFLGDGVRLPENFHKSLEPIQRFRIRLVWILGRLTYESHLWVPALKAHVSPPDVLYGSSPPAMLKDVSLACLQVTRASILGHAG